MINEKIYPVRAPVIATIGNSVLSFFNIKSVRLQELFEAVIQPRINSAEVIRLLLPNLEIGLEYYRVIRCHWYHQAARMAGASRLFRALGEW